MTDLRAVRANQIKFVSGIDGDGDDNDKIGCLLSDIDPSRGRVSERLIACLGAMPLRIVQGDSRKLSTLDKVRAVEIGGVIRQLFFAYMRMFILLGCIPHKWKVTAYLDEQGADRAGGMGPEGIPPLDSDTDLAECMIGEIKGSSSGGHKFMICGVPEECRRKCEAYIAFRVEFEERRGIRMVVNDGLARVKLVKKNSDGNDIAMTLEGLTSVAAITSGDDDTIPTLRLVMDGYRDASGGDPECFKLAPNFLPPDSYASTPYGPAVAGKLKEKVGDAAHMRTDAYNAMLPKKKTMRRRVAPHGAPTGRRARRRRTRSRS